jgi:PAS domain S-box-containing protein
MPQALKVLIVEDDSADAELVVRELRRAGFDPDWQRVDTEAEYLERLQCDLDLVLSDYVMPQFSGLRALELLKQSRLDIPFIIVSGTIGEDTAVAAMKHGAGDYLLKDRLGRLGAAVTHAMAECRLRQEKRQTDEALRIAHAHLGELLEHSPAALYVVRFVGGRIVPHLVSENIATLLGFTAAEALSYDWWAGQLHPDDRDRIVTSITNALEDGTSFLEYRLRHKDGHYRWISDSRRLIRDASGAPAELIGVLTDFTARKRAEETVRQANVYLARNRKKLVIIELAVLVSSTVAIYGFGSRFNWFEAATRWEEARQILTLNAMFLATAFFVIGLTVFAFRRWRESESELTSRQQTQAALGLLHNELDRQVKQRTEELGKANQALLESEVHYRLLFDRNPFPMWLYDLETLRFLAVNESAMQQYGYTREEFLGMTIKQIYLSEDVGKLLSSLEHGEVESKKLIEWRHRRKDGAVIHAEVSARPLLLDGRTVRLVLAADVTEKKLLQEQLLHAQRLESLGMLAAGIAHDLNNVLAPIVFAAPLLRMNATDPHDLKILDTLENSAKRGAGLVRQILGFARSTTGEFQLTQVKHLIQDIIELMEETFPKSIRIERKIKADPWSVHGNPTQIHQVLLNLCVNARDAMPQGGTLRIDLTNRKLDKEQALALPGAQSGEWLVIEVSDTGIGIMPDVLARIWEPFFTTKGAGKGTGLGLSTVRGIVAGHGGFINVRSTVGSGTAFTVFLPAVRDEGKSDTEAHAELPRPGNGELILVVDDEEPVREITARILIKHGYRVVTACNGADAIKVFMPLSAQVRLLLTDEQMPIMGGRLLAGALRRLKSGLPVCAMSGANDQSREKGDDLSASFLVKPFEATALLEVVRRALDEAQPPVSAPSTALLYQ